LREERILTLEDKNGSQTPKGETFSGKTKERRFSQSDVYKGGGEQRKEVRSSSLSEKKESCNPEKTELLDIARLREGHQGENEYLGEGVDISHTFRKAPREGYNRGGTVAKKAVL